MKRAIVCGGAGFIGAHLIKRLKREGYYVRSVDRKHPEFEPSEADQSYFADLRNAKGTWMLPTAEGGFDEVYQLAANMGGMGFLGNADNDADTLRDNALINLHVLDACVEMNKFTPVKVFFASSACVYSSRPVYATFDGPPGKDAFDYREDDAYPAHPDLEYGWEKLFSERLYAAYGRRHGFETRIARFHNVFGPLGAWKGGREKAPAAICRKIAEAREGDPIEIWGDGTQRRSFLYVDEAIEGVRRLMNSDFREPINIGSSHAVTIDQLVDLVAGVAGKTVTKMHVPGPIGVAARNSDNTLVRETLDWAPSDPLFVGLRHTYPWIAGQVERENAAQAQFDASSVSSTSKLSEMLTRIPR